MDRYTYETQCWLDLRFNPEAHAAFGSKYAPYQPVYGIADGGFGPDQFLMAARWTRLVALLHEMGPGSFLDVGGAEGFVSGLVREAAGCDVVSMDLSIEAGLRAREIMDVPALAADSAMLPFADASFDYVFMSEVLEHLAHPVRTLLELRRVARRAVIVTTEAIALDEAKRDEELASRNLRPHMDRSIFCPGDFRRLLAEPLLVTNQAMRIPAPMPSTRAEVKAALSGLLDRDELAWPAHGIIVVSGPAAPRVFPRERLKAALDRVFARLEPRAPWAAADRGGVMPRIVAEQMRCPVCHANLALRGERIDCGACGRTFECRRGVANLTTPEGDGPGEALREVAVRALRGSSAAVVYALSLDERLRFDLPPTWTGEDIAAAPAELFEAGPHASVAAGDGVVRVSARADDAHIVTPRLVLPRERVASIAFEIRAVECARATERVQVYWWTLRRPLWWERSSRVASYAADGRWHEVRMDVPVDESFPPGDELIRLRIDIADGPGTFEVRRLKIL